MDYLELISFVKKNGDKSLLSLIFTMNCASIRLSGESQSDARSVKSNHELRNKTLLADLLSNGFFVATLENVSFTTENLLISYEMSFFVVDLIEARRSDLIIKEIAIRKHVEEFVYIPKKTLEKNNYSKHFIKKSYTIIDTNNLLIDYERLVDIHKLPCSGFGHISMHRFAMK